MPPVPSIIISSAIFGLLYLIMRQNAFMFFPGFILGYLMYGTMHYAIHAWNPPFKWMKPFGETITCIIIKMNIMDLV